MAITHLRLNPQLSYFKVLDSPTPLPGHNANTSCAVAFQSQADHYAMFAHELPRTKQF